MDVKSFWDSRASLAELAGTRDLIARELEVEAISKYVRDGMRVLDLGCGVGLTARELAQRFDIEIHGIDYSEQMIRQAIEMSKGMENPRVSFGYGDVTNLNPNALDPYDLIYSQRCLINLPDWSTQAQAIRNICALLKPGGQYIAIENEMDGLAKINEMRAALDLPEIVPPEHNRYWYSGEVYHFSTRLYDETGVIWDDPAYFGSTYAFLSRVVNARLAADAGEEPDYDSPINKLALKLPPMGNFGQYCLWRWKRVR